MIRRAASLAISGVGLALFGAAIVVPTAVLLIRTVAEDGSGLRGAFITPRQLELLQRTVGLAWAATALALVMSLPGAYAVALASGAARRSGTLALLAAPLLLPPMVMVFGWQKVLAATWGPLGDVARRGLCVALWAGWAWPVPALILGSAWRRTGRDAFESALLDTPVVSAFLHAGRATLAAPVALCAALLFALFCGEYSVPHACGLIVYGTELLGWASTAKQPGEVVLPALPLLATMLAAVALAGVVARRARLWTTPDPHDRGTAGWSVRATLPAVLMVGITVVIPLTALVVRVIRLHGVGATDRSGAMWLAWSTYRGALLESAAVALAAGVGAVWLGAATASAPRGARIAGVWAFLFGVMPGALIGEAIVTTYRPIGLIYNAWPVVVLGSMARFGWVGVLTAWLTARSVGRDVIEQARSDGASEWDVAVRIRLGGAAPLLACGAAVTAALALADVATAAMVQVPSVRLVSMILIEKFHRFEDGMLTALSLWLVAAALPGAILLAIAQRLRTKA